MVPHERYPNDGLLLGHGDLGSEIGEELLSGEYRADMGGVVK
jgi:hypothetical protein